MKDDFNTLQSAERAAEILQSGIDAVLAHAAKFIIELPGEEGYASNFFWNAINANKFKDMLGFNSYATRMVGLITNYELPERRHGELSLLDYLLSLQRTEGFRNIPPAHLRFSGFRNMFRYFASKEERIKFSELQNHKIEQLNNLLLKGYAQDILSHGVAMTKELEKIEDALGAKRLKEYIQHNRDYFESKIREGASNYAPELGFIIGTDLPKVKRIIETLIQIQNPFFGIKKLAESEGTNEAAMMRFICCNPSIFENHQQFVPLLALRGMATEAMTTDTFVRTNQDMGYYLSGRLQKEHGVDITPGQATRTLKLTLNEWENEAFLAGMRALKAGEKPRISLGVMSPNRIKSANNIEAGVADIFKEETMRPARGDRREAGGRVGFGPKIPRNFNSREPE